MRPTPSPDGRYLAFVRRVRAVSRLFVRDLVTGQERMLVDRLDQDMQESWAVHGVYPNMAFTPDSASIVFWSGGKIQRVVLDSGAVSDIPFRIEDTRTVYEAPRFAVDVAPDTFRTRMPRWAQVIPGTDAVVFESLGRLHLKLPAAEPARLTRGDSERLRALSHRESRRQWVYYVAWSDTELGQIMRVASRGGRPRVLSQVPGHYRELRSVPMGRHCAYRQANRRWSAVG